jgi:CRP/FNR family cyclic AMP-dependent transcriptional regulator
MPRSDVERLMERNPAFSRDLMHKLIRTVRNLSNRVLDLSLKDVYGRFVKFLDEHAVDRDGKLVVPERLTQHDIAARIGGSREMVSRIVKDLTAGGYITIDAKHITIHKKPPAHW